MAAATHRRRPRAPPKCPPSRLPSAASVTAARPTAAPDNRPEHHLAVDRREHIDRYVTLIHLQPSLVRARSQRHHRVRFTATRHHGPSPRFRGVARHRRQPQQSVRRRQPRRQAARARTSRRSTAGRQGQPRHQAAQPNCHDTNAHRRPAAATRCSHCCSTPGHASAAACSRLRISRVRTGAAARALIATTSSDGDRRPRHRVWCAPASVGPMASRCPTTSVSGGTDPAGNRYRTTDAVADRGAAAS